jgi:hypothetical protein
MTEETKTKQILATLAWIASIQAPDGLSIAVAEHRAGLKLLADQFGELVEDNAKLSARLNRREGDGRKRTGPKRTAPRCRHGKLNTESSRKRNPRHECWNISQLSQIVVGTI